MMIDSECPVCGGDLLILGALGEWVIQRCQQCGHDVQTHIDEDDEELTIALEAI